MMIVRMESNLVWNKNEQKKVVSISENVKEMKRLKYSNCKIMINFKLNQSFEIFK